MARGMVKLRIHVDPTDWHGEETETMWAAPISGTDWTYFRLMNSPFFARGLSYRDIVKATPTHYNLVFDFERVVERGGHSTYMVIVEASKPRAAAYWNMLEKIGCSYESGQIGFTIGRREVLSVDVPPSTDVHEAFEILERGEDDGVWMFQEGYAYLPDRERETSYRR